MPEPQDNWSERVRMILGDDDARSPEPPVPLSSVKGKPPYQVTDGYGFPDSEALTRRIESRIEGEEWYETQPRVPPTTSSIRLNGILYLRADSGFEVQKVTEVKGFLDPVAFSQRYTFRVDAVCKVCRNVIIFSMPIREYDLAEVGGGDPRNNPEVLASILRGKMSQEGCPLCGNKEKLRT